MLRRISQTLQAASSPWTAALASAVFLSFLVFFLPRQAARSPAGTENLPAPDTSLLYSGEDLYRLAGDYGEEGRKEYIQDRFTFDLIFPLAYGFFLTLWIGLALKRIHPRLAGWRLLNLFPPAGMAFDYLENISTSAVMAAYPDRIPIFQAAAPAFTLTKWIFVSGSFVVLIGVLIWWGISSSRKQPDDQPSRPSTGD